VRVPPILSQKDYTHSSVFTPGNLLREARRQRSVAEGVVPEICVLDPDGDMVHLLRETGRAHKSASWPCYHTTLYTFTEGDLTTRPSPHELATLCYVASPGNCSKRSTRRSSPHSGSWTTASGCRWSGCHRHCHGSGLCQRQSNSPWPSKADLGRGRGRIVGEDLLARCAGRERLMGW
jgi:hypothetical protein